MVFGVEITCAGKIEARERFEADTVPAFHTWRGLHGVRREFCVVHEEPEVDTGLDTSELVDRVADYDDVAFLGLVAGPAEEGDCYFFEGHVKVPYADGV